MDLHGQRCAQRADRRPAGAGPVHGDEPGRHGDGDGDGDDHRHQRRGDGELGLEICDGRRHGGGANTSGQLTITDPDAGEAHVVAQTNAHGTYGDFSIDANGAWTYTGNGAHDELTAGQQVQDQFTVTSQDGTATRTVTVTITGTNDAATVSSDSKSVTEGDTAAALNTSGAADDHRPGPRRGACRCADQCAWHLRRLLDRRQRGLDLHRQRAHNELTAGQQVQDQFTVTSQDGTASGR